MANLDFFGVREDLRAVLVFVFGATDLRVFELSSEFDQELREFTSVDQVESAFRLGDASRGGQLLLNLWSPSVMKTLDIRRVELDQRRCKGHTFRYTLEGWGCIQLYLGGIQEKTIRWSHYGHNTEARARTWGHEDGADWDALKLLSNKIQYHIRCRLAVAKVRGRPILPEAFRLLSDGYALQAPFAAGPVTLLGSHRGGGGPDHG
ncbi:MAG: hypothetical protein KF878_25135 [Planctomycetes bacterium]|nr:hypothetical protein [Planctomycetota bacterium]